MTEEDLHAFVMVQIAAMEARLKDEQKELVRQLATKWRINDEADSLSLQIELGNDYAVTLTIHNGEKPSVALWYGNGEHSFLDESRASFRGWLDELAFSVD